MNSHRFLEEAFEKWWSRQCYEESDNAMFTAKAAWDIQQAKIAKLTKALEAFPAAVSEAGANEGWVCVKEWERFNTLVTEALSSVEK